MKRVCIVISALLLAIQAVAAMNIEKIDPPFWYAGMEDNELQLMVYGKDIAHAKVGVSYPGVRISSTVKLESDNYLLVYLTLSDEVKPGNVKLTFKEGKRQITKAYELKARTMAGSERKGFDASDALYLLMPDRFANGDTTNDQLQGMAPYEVNRNNPDARHGGDLAGIEQHLDYFSELGVTALWFTPVLENNMPGGSYHGYATTDYYRVDPRFGTNEDYCRLIAKAHARGLKIVMDMIFNHCGTGHPWVSDMPSKDWFNYPDFEEHYVQTSYVLTPYVDPYASKYDFDQMSRGWFVPAMPDLNQSNPHVLKYLIQNSFWWIEYAGIDGIRMDTYPYADYDAMSRWMAALNAEYPHYNVVGETWVTEPAYTAWWQKDSKLSAPRNSHLKTVMDFSFYDKINQAMREESSNYTGLGRIYNNFVYDFLYPNPLSVLAFIENHDTDRFLGEGNNLAALKQAATLLLTTRRIPQLYYGTEVLMNGTKQATDGHVRKDFPGGWTSDEANAFTSTQLDSLQRDCYRFFQCLLHWRKENEVIARGSMTQFLVQQGVYAYARHYEGRTVLVLLNGTDAPTTLPLHPYKEVLGNAVQGRDVISGRIVRLDKALQMAAREALVVVIRD
ncbi:MAG: glycoside hydrolase family 13 protein [Bacteroides sp.]|nr:glycoside hydrolase family 13 protein [Bacteroides sp.]